MDDVKNSGSGALPDSPVRPSETPAVHVDTECVPVTQQEDAPPLPTNEDSPSAEKAGMESEMDSSDVSNVSAATLVRTTYQNSE